MSLTEAQRAEIAAHEQETFSTRRPTVAALEAMLYAPQEVLDHGFLRVIDYMAMMQPLCRRPVFPTAGARARYRKMPG